jgi:hypothetical protein
MNHEQIKSKWLGKRYRESVSLGYQCVAWIKKYCDEAYWLTGLSFWGSAYTGWNREWNLDTFFDRVESPRTWDIIFFDKTLSNPYGHVAIVDSVGMIIEQNWGSGGGTGLWSDSIRLAKQPTNVLGYMRKKWGEPLMPIEDLRKIWQWVKVRKFNDYSQDERAKMIFDIWLS